MDCCSGPPGGDGREPLVRMSHAGDRSPGLRPWTTGSIAVATLIQLAACAGGSSAARPSPSVKPGEFGTAACFYRRQVEDFTVLDPSNLIVYAPNKANAYHVYVSPPEPELRSASTLGFSSRSSEICGYSRDALVLDAAGGHHRVPIFGVYRLNDAALSGLLTRFRLNGAKPKPADGAVAGPKIDRSLDETPDQQDKSEGDQPQ